MFTKCNIFKIADTIGPISILCGAGMSVPMETRTNAMYVEFTSNGVVSFTGFNMSYGQIQSKLLSPKYEVIFTNIYILKSTFTFAMSFIAS